MSRRFTAGLLVVSAGLALVAYANSFDNGFHFDDGHSIEDNVFVRDLAYVPRYFTDVATFSPLAENRSYRPLLLASYAVSHAIGGGHPWAYHLLSVLLHIFASFVVGALAYRFFQDRMLAFFGAATFAVHPLLSESVNYISARSSLMGSTLMFATVLLYIRARTSEREHRGLVITNVVLVLALFTKLLAVTVPALLIAWEFLLAPRRTEDNETKDTWRDWAYRLAPPSLIAAAFAVLHESIVGATARGARSDITPWSHLLTQTRVWQRYQGLFVWPEDLCADLVMAWSKVPWEGDTARAILWAVATVFVAWFARKRAPVLSFAIVWFYVALSPTNSFVPLSEPATEHRAYVAAPALVWAALVGLRALRDRWPRPTYAVAALLIAAMAVTTLRRNRVWADESSLWSDVIECAPTNGRAHLNYGRALFGTGDYTGAREAYDACVTHWPGYPFCYINLVVLDLEEGRLDLAQQNIAAAERLAPNNVYTHVWRGAVEVQAERYDRAVQAYDRALRVAPSLVDAERGRAHALFELGRTTEAQPTLERLGKQNQLFSFGWYALGYFAESRADTAGAESNYRRALAFRKPDPRARYNLATLLHRSGRIDEAIVEYLALQNEGSATPDALFNLALALAQRGRVDEARVVRTQLQRVAPRFPRLGELRF